MRRTKGQIKGLNAIRVLVQQVTKISGRLAGCRNCENHTL